MSKVAVEYNFSGSTAGMTATYDSTKLILGDKIFASTGSIAPLMPQVSPVNDATGSYFCFPNAYKWSDRYNWVFAGDTSSASSTRRIAFWEHDIWQNTLTYKGYILLNFVNLTGNKTGKGLYVEVTKESTGTVGTGGASSSTITGSGTKFVENGIAAGARIGFGSTDPTQITTWYNISTITSDTSLTINTPATVADGTAYVIEEIRICYAFTNATATFGGIALVKGINYSTFQAGGVSIAEGTTAGGDNKQAVYFLKDAATTNMTIVQGVDGMSAFSMTTHNIFCVNADAAATSRIYQYNMRASLTMQAYGFHVTNAFVQRTGQIVVPSNIGANGGNTRIATLRHGPGLGVESLYFATTNRVQRVPLNDIGDASGSGFSGSVSYIRDSMLENPPGGSNTTATSSATFNGVHYLTSADRLIVNINAAPYRAYIYQYDTGGSLKADRIFGGDFMRTKVAATDSAAPVGVFFRAASPFFDEENNVTYCITIQTASTQCHLISFAASADLMYADSTLQYAITPRIATPNATKLYRVYVAAASVTGSDKTTSFATEPYEVYFRTVGIDDNSGAWTLVPPSGDISGIAPGSYIQFKLKWRTIGEYCVPSTIYSITCVYEDQSQDSHYIPSVSKSSAASLIFAWKQVVAWGTTIPTMKISVFNADTSALILQDTTASPTMGTWEYSTNGTVWNAWSSSADAVGNYVRYTATTLPNNVNVRALIQQA